MDLLEAPWTAERFIEWDNRQEQKHEFDGTRIVAMTGGSRDHQRICFNLTHFLIANLDPAVFDVIQEMRIRTGRSVRYPDVVVTTAPIAGQIRTLTDAVVLFEVLSDETARTDSLDKLNEYATLPSIRHYVLVEQRRMGALINTREADRWIVQAVTEGVVALPGIGAELQLPAIYANVAV